MGGWGRRWMDCWPVLVMALAAPLSAQQSSSRSVAVDLPAGRLSDALNVLARQTGVEIIFSPQTVAGIESPRLRGRLAPATALEMLLRGTRLIVRRTPEGGFIMTEVEPQSPPPEPPVPEILVIGRRSQNTDIVRTRNEVQPYRVFGQRDVEASHAATPDEFLRARLPSDAQILSPIQDPLNENGSGRSRVDLHGLGSGQTLVLVDGTRMPSVPSLDGVLLQPDLNGLPVRAIDRIEALTATSGGIYGPGATGGVVNVVLRRAYRGADISVGVGETGQGGASTRRVDARLGFTPDGGRTDVELTIGASRRARLPLGARDLTVRGRARLETTSPDDYAAFAFPVDGILIQSQAGNLSFTPAAGGQQVGSPLAYLPLSSAGASAATVTATDPHSLPLALSPDANGAARSLTSGTETQSLLMNVRHRFGVAFEAFADVIALEDNGSAVYSTLPSNLFLEAGAVGNPFSQAISIIYPTPGLDSIVTSRLRTTRATFGVIASLPHGWRAEAQVALGEARYAFRKDGLILSDTPANVAGGPLGDWNTFVAGLRLLAISDKIAGATTNRLQDASLRLAGPLFRLPGGDLTLSLLAEGRRERIASASTVEEQAGEASVIGTTPGSAQRVGSVYGELRAPMAMAGPRPSPWRGLELQLAARFDAVTTSRSADPAAPGEELSSRLTQRGAAFTAGIKVEPLPHVLLRASYATGTLPAASDQVVTSAYVADFPGVNDPRRGGEPVGAEAPYRVLVGRPAYLRPELARTLSLGAVLNPEGGRRVRLSIDYVRIRKTDEVSNLYANNVAYFLAEEAVFPGRVVRTPLTAADQAAGFTGGLVTQVDTTALNIGRTRLDAIDIDADYATALPIGGHLRIYGLATWEPRLSRRQGPDTPWYDSVGHLDGPLAWRGNAGFDWMRGRVTIGSNVQFYSGYRITLADPANEFLNPLLQGYQGADRIAAQAYVDLTAAYRLPLPGVRGRWLELGAAILNVGDHQPPLVLDPSGLGYSSWGDPRGRRFEITASAHF
jgi:iron complex outermembrane recepter protein